MFGGYVKEIFFFLQTQVSDFFFFFYKLFAKMLKEKKKVLKFEFIVFKSQSVNVYGFRVEMNEVIFIAIDNFSDALKLNSLLMGFNLT